MLWNGRKKRYYARIQMTVMCLGMIDEFALRKIRIRKRYRLLQRLIPCTCFWIAVISLRIPTFTV